MPPTSLLPAPEFTILDSGLAFGTGTLHHAWFRLADPRGRESVRAVALKELAYLPIETRDDPDLLGKQWAALRGLYNADVDFVFSCLGVFAPTMLGVVQFYGAAAEASSREVAHPSGSFNSTSDSVGGFNSSTTSQSRGTADSTGWADSRGSADSTGWADSTGQAVSATTGRGWSESTSTSQASTQGVADTESWSRSVPEGWSEGRAVSRSTQAGRSHTQADAAGQAVALSAGRGFTGGFGAGLVPGISIGRSWQTEDDVAMRLTDIARGLESLLNQASMEGGFLTTALLFVGEEGERAAQALAPQAFHGPGVPTPVLTVAGDAALRLHALAFRPSLTPEPDPFDVGLLWSKWGTLLTPGMLAAYTLLMVNGERIMVNF